MEPSKQQLLQSIKKTLSEKVSTVGAESKRQLNLSVLAIDELLRREKNNTDIDTSLHNKLSTLVMQGDKLIKRLRLEPSVFAWPSRPSELISKDKQQQDIEKMWLQLVSQVSILLEYQNETTISIEVRGFIADVASAEIEEKLRSPQDETSDDSSISTHQRLSKLSDYFRSHLSASKDFKLIEITQLSGGFSNETFKIVTADNNKTTHIVVRLSRNNGIQWPYVASLEEELPFLKLVRSSGVPAPKPLWLETDTTLLGGPFLVVEHIPGKVVGDALRASDLLSDALVENYAQALAKLHMAPWQDWADKLPKRFVPSTQLTVTDAITLIMERMKSYLDASWISPSPIIIILFKWLEKHKPNSQATPVLTHGDLGFHNWLFDGDRPLALLDWETIALCSPTKDLANVRDVVIPSNKWDYFLNAYITAGGSPLIESELPYYAVLRQLQAVICTSVAIEKMFTLSDPLNIDYLELGIQARAYFYLDISKNLPELI